MSARLALADILAENTAVLLARVEEALSSTVSALPRQRTIERLPALLRDLVERLRSGSSDESAILPVPFDFAPMMTALSVLKESLYALIDKRHVSITPRDLRFIGGWFAAARLSTLLAENRRYAVMLDSLSNHVLLGNAGGAVIYINKATGDTAANTTGLSRDEVLGYRTGDVARDKRFARYVDACIDRAACGESISEDFLFPTPDGTRWHEHNLRPVYGPGGEVEAIATTSRDIDARKRAEARLQLLSKLGALSETMDHEAIFDAMARLSIPELADCCIINIVEHGQLPRSTIAHRDPAKAALAEELLSHPSQLHKLPVGQAALAGRSTLITDVTQSSEHAYLAHSEIAQRFEVRSSMVAPFVVMGAPIAIASFMMTSESGRSYGADDFVFAQEVARRAAQVIENVRLHQRIRQSEARFRLALDHAGISVFETDLELRLRWGYDSMLGAPGSMAVGRRLSDLVGREVGDEMDPLKRRVIETGEGERRTVSAIVNGARRHFMIRCEPLRSMDGIVGLIGAIVDVTEAKEAEEQIARELAFRERMMGILGHDLRNPVSAVLSIAGLMRLQNGVDDKTREQVVLIEQSARRMNEMIGTLLDFTRLRFQGSLPIALAEVDLGELARNVLAELRAAYRAREIDLSISGNLRGEWDPGRIAQLFTNLVANALTHGERGSPVWIALAGEEDSVLLTVGNRGETIPSALAERLFDPFQQGDGSDIAARRGLGLGLFIVREIVRAHRGTVSLRSGDGLVTFVLRLPRNAPAKLDDIAAF